MFETFHTPIYFTCQERLTMQAKFCRILPVYRLFAGGVRRSAPARWILIETFQKSWEGFKISLNRHGAECAAGCTSFSGIKSITGSLASEQSCA